jgi:hypothetical protein
MRRFIQQSDGELVEVERDYVAIERASNRYVGDSHYDGLRSTDGANISTRTKHREYMKRHGLATVDDFKGEFIKKGEARKRFMETGYDPTRRPQIERAYRELLQRKQR